MAAKAAIGLKGLITKWNKKLLIEYNYLNLNSSSKLTHL